MIVDAERLRVLRSGKEMDKAYKETTMADYEEIVKPRTGEMGLWEPEYDERKADYPPSEVIVELEVIGGC